MAPEDPKTIVLVTLLAKLIYRRSSDSALGMGLKEYSVLGQLRDSSVPQNALATSLHLDENLLVLLLNELEASELIARRRDPSDRRRHIVEITAKGRRALERAERGMEAFEEEILSGLTAAERGTLRRLLSRAVEGAQAPART